MQKRTRRLLQASLGFLFAAGFLYLAVRTVDMHEFWHHIKAVDYRSLPPILLLLVLFFWMKAIRWKLLLRPVRRLTTKEVTPALMIGFMGNNVLPAHLGEFVRMYVLGRQYGVRKAAVLSTIVLERVLDFLAIIGLFVVTLQFVPASDGIEAVRVGGYVIGAAAGAIMILFAVFVTKTAWALRLADRLLPASRPRLRKKILDLMELGALGLDSLRHPRLMAATAALTIGHWLLIGFSYYLAVISFPLDAPLPLFGGLFLMTVAALGVTLPSAPGYVGTTQYCFVVALAAFGVSREAALAASFYALITAYVPVTLVGIVFLSRLGLSLRALNSEVEEARDDVDAPRPQPMADVVK